MQNRNQNDSRATDLILFPNGVWGHDPVWVNNPQEMTANLNLQVFLCRSLQGTNLPYAQVKKTSKPI